jgi:hypothetical protein
MVALQVLGQGHRLTRLKIEVIGLICRELLGLSEKNSSPVPEERTAKYYAKRPCGEIVKCAAEITENVIDDIYRKIEEEITAKFKDCSNRTYE